MDFPMNQLLAKTYLENQKKRKEQEKISRQKKTLLDEFRNPYQTGTGNTYILKQQDYNQIFGKGYSTLFNENTPKYQLRKLFQTKRQQEQMQELLEKSSLKTLKALKNSIEEFNDFVSYTFAEELAEGLGKNPKKIEINTNRVRQQLCVVHMASTKDFAAIPISPSFAPGSQLQGTLLENPWHRNYFS